MAWIFVTVALMVAAYSGFEVSRGRIAAAPTLLVSLMLFTAAMAWGGLLYSDFALVWSRRGAQVFGFENCLYISAILVLYLVVYVIASRGRHKVDVTFLKTSASKSLNVIALAILAFAAYQLSITNLELLWSNAEYLLIGSVRSISDPNSLASFVVRFSKFVAVVAFSLLGFAIIQRRRLVFWLLLPACVWFMTVALAGHSRNAVVYAAVTATVLFISRRHRALAVGFAGLAVLNLANSLYGRASGSHGVESLGSYFTYGFDISFEDIGRFFTNLFEGVFTQGETFYFAGMQHPDRYKLLSFSPLPSFLDGFDSILSSEIRLHTYVPMGATGEVLLFGVEYMLVYYAVVLLAYYMVTRAVTRRQSYLTLGLLCLFLMASHVQFAYPTRWGFRIFIFVIIASYLSRFRVRWSRASAHEWAVGSKAPSSTLHR